MRSNLSSIVLAVVGLTSLSVALPLSIARAQQAGLATAAPASPQDQRFVAPPAEQTRGANAVPGQPGQFQPGGGMMRGAGMGASTMLDDDSSLYVLQGNRLFKINKSDLRVVKEGMLPGQPPMARPGDQQGFGGGAAGGDKK